MNSNKIQATINGVSFCIETSERVVEVNGVVFKFGETVKETPKIENKSVIVKVSNFVYHNKIQAIKAIREASGLGLKESKDTIEIIQANSLYSDRAYPQHKAFLSRMLEFRGSRNLQESNGRTGIRRRIRLTPKGS